MAGTESYEVTVDIQALTDMYRAQNAKYARKLGILIAALCAPFAVIGVLAAVMDPEPSYVAVVVVLIAITLLGVGLATGRLVTLAGRRPYVNAWFARRSDTDPRGAAAKELGATFRVRLSEWGFEEVSHGGTVTRTPWAFMRPKPTTVPEGVCFTLEDGKRSSLAYNLIGINGALRAFDERLDGLLLVPQDVVDANPGLVEDISARVRASVGSQGPVCPDEVREWLGTTQPAGDAGEGTVRK